MQWLLAMGTPGHMHLKISYIVSNEQRVQHVSGDQEGGWGVTELP